MFSLKTIGFLCGLILTFGLSNLYAETIYLKSGETIEGKIINYSDESLTVEINKTDEPIQFQKNQILLINFGKGAQQQITKKKKFENPLVLYLKNGEVLRGKVTQFNKDYVTIESEQGVGSIQLPSTELSMIVSTTDRIDMTQRNGFGYHMNKSALHSTNGPGAYDSDQLSYKFYLDKTMFSDILFAFGNVKSNEQVFKVVSLDYRLGVVFDQKQNTQFYYGGSAGYMQIKDDVNAIEGSGVSLKGFLGAEMFFNSLPNFGFAGEIGFGIKKIGEYSSSDVSTSSFPSFSIHYYY
ncbi:MAG: hypothetical protein OEY59_06390 [Deltaproteobacteria bacterium]|nr:hypothetical protein [Deltaproteobacteria bacterium]